MFCELGEQILQSFLNVDASITLLWRHVLFDLKNLPVWSYDGDNELVEDRGEALRAIKQFTFATGLTAKETLACPGAIASTNETLVLVMAANETKAAFKQVIAESKQALKHEGLPFVHDILKRAGFSAINLRQVTRLIPLINFHPRRIAWSMVKHGSNKRQQPEALKEALLTIGEGENISWQLEKLEALRSKEPLVVHHEIDDVWQANISSFKQGRVSTFSKKRTSLPIFYLHDPLLPTPVVCFSEENPNNRVRKKRVDKKIDDVPFLPTVSAYRYK